MTQKVVEETRPQVEPKLKAIEPRTTSQIKAAIQESVSICGRTRLNNPAANVVVPAAISAGNAMRNAIEALRVRAAISESASECVS